MATAIIIVSYRTPGDVADCLHALDAQETPDPFGVFIVENGGSEAFDKLLKAAAAACGESPRDVDADTLARVSSSRHLTTKIVNLPQSKRPVLLAQAVDNLGYAGGINSWLERNAGNAQWTGYWILNPDTAPDPKALSALIEACEPDGCGMAASVIMDYRDRSRIVSRGLRWRPWRGGAVSVDHGSPLSLPLPDPTKELDAPSGTSFYVTQACLDAIGFMNEDYFLYFEDLDWGMRAKKAGLLVRANGSLVPHKYGSSLGSATRRAERSPLSVYLDMRNTLLFTQRHYRAFFPWVVARSAVRVVEYLVVGSTENASASLSGLLAGVRGQSGRPGWHQ